MGYIYLFTNKINGKQYVGKTKSSIHTRWIQHKSEAKRLTPNVYFIRALHKYGIENFEVEEIEQCPNDLLFEREQHYIEIYDTYYNGYNSNKGGAGNYKYDSDEILMLWHDGFTVSEIANVIGCCNQTVSNTLRGEGIPVSETRSRGATRYSESKKKPILQYTLDGKLINQFTCIEEAATNTGYSETAIRDVCNHRRFSSNGYIWCHSDEPKTIEELIAEKPLEKTKHPIAQYTLSGALVAEYDSIADAAETLHVHRSSIENALANKAFNCNGFLWKYQDDPEDIMEKVKRNNSKKDYAKKAVKQYDLEKNYIATYDSAAAAAIAIGKPGNGSSITKACKGKLKTAYQYIWTYADS